MPFHDPGAAPAGVPTNLTSTWRPADRCGFLQSAGARLRYAIWNAYGTPRGTVVVLPGRGEFIEKYATEVVGELLDRGFAVYALDWRGQGLSDRPLANREKGHIDTFTTYMADLQLFIDAVVAPTAPRPILALAHSMGGHTLLRYLAQPDRSPLLAAVVVSPMLALGRAGIIRALLGVLSPFGLRDEAFMVATGPYEPKHRNFATNDVTDDETRYRWTDKWFESDPRLRLGGPTIGWLRQALGSVEVLETSGALEAIDRPILLVSASVDKVVDPAAHPVAVSRMPRAELVVVENAKHEILMETDARRDRFWTAFDRFTKGVLGQ